MTDMGKGAVMGSDTAQRSEVGDGVLNICKPAGWTSHDVVAKIRRWLRGTKVGHAGTLDPAATGVLPVLVGRATRIAEFLVAWDKEYQAVLRLGVITDTQDATGTVLACRAVDHLTDEAIRTAVHTFQGEVTQVPPMYSAIKVAGVPLYRTARAGHTIARDARTVAIHALDVLGIDGSDVSLRIVCSKGTYVRTLCADIGERLGVGGHLLSLVRTRVGGLTVEHGVTLEEIHERIVLSQAGAVMLSLDEALEQLPALLLSDAVAQRAVHGVPVPLKAIEADVRTRAAVLLPGQVVRLKDQDGRLVALGRMPQAEEVALTTERRGSAESRALPILKVLVDA